jgi:hypothetical protein
MKLPWLLSVGLSQPTLHFLPALAALSLSLSPQNVSVSEFHRQHTGWLLLTPGFFTPSTHSTSCMMVFALGGPCSWTRTRTVLRGARAPRAGGLLRRRLPPPTRPGPPALLRAIECRLSPSTTSPTSSTLRRRRVGRHPRLAGTSSIHGFS